MKIKLFFIATLLFSVYLTGCARNNVNNDVAYRNRNGMDTTRVNYNDRNNGPAVRDNDITNPRLVTDVRNDDRTIDNVNNRRNGDGTINKYDNRRNGDNTINNTNDGKTRMAVADRAAEKVADLRAVDQANVIVTDNNAYVAAQLADNYGDKLTNKIENKIADRVKSVDRDIDNVYVSVNPDFYDRMTSYSNDLRAGKPVTGFFDEFTQTIRRIFPDMK